MPDSSFLKVNFGLVQDAVADLQRGVSTLDTKLGDLDRDARPLVTTWDGTAQAAYNAHQQAWTKAAQDLKNVLMHIQKALDASLHEYIATEQGNTRLFT